MKLTPEGPLVQPSPAHRDSLQLRRIATHTLNISLEEWMGRTNDSTARYVEMALVAFRDWVSEQTGYPTDCLHLVVTTAAPTYTDPYNIRLDAYVLVGTTYMPEPTHHYVRYRRHDLTPPAYPSKPNLKHTFIGDAPGPGDDDEG